MITSLSASADVVEIRFCGSTRFSPVSLMELAVVPKITPFAKFMLEEGVVSVAKTVPVIVSAKIRHNNNDSILRFIELAPFTPNLSILIFYLHKGGHP